MTKKQYRKMIRIVAAVLLIGNIFLMVRNFMLKDNIESAIRIKENLNLKRTESDALLIEFEDTYNKAEEDSYWLLKEKENWVRQNQKLEDILY